MSFQNLEPGRIVRAVVVIFALGIVFSFLTSCLSVMFWPQNMIDRLTNTLDSVTDPDVPQTQLQDDLTSIFDEYGSELSASYALQWSIASIVTFVIARRTAARAATSQAQAGGYGLAIGLGAAFTYGVLCVMFTITMLWLRMLFFLALILAGMFGGQAAVPLLGKTPREDKPRFEPAGRGMLNRPTAAPQTPLQSGPRPEIYYNMGVTAAMGGRREEARQHFTRVVQMQPRNVAAWLQLANLADTPEQAWNYVQQARAIEPDNAQVKEAVSIIWPRVQSSATGAPAVQPPYPGGANDDPGIPQIQMPRITPPEPPAAPPADDDQRPE
ncbi:MAG TPA: hypothetical protein PKD09_18820 [Aggregatilinea sp.]|uniref:tetratricopeptide repeat protein n=1 Tax=Aggregatilinea sp. TaxID=2806333 RepID=UPI002CFA1063|nr:hypothetical protein [Aggregatilinea sp.]HML23717.1 hypothetical protein [Aggregatilinea sp.]